MNMKATAVAIVLGFAWMTASAADRPTVNAAYLQMVFTPTADDCRATQKAWSQTTGGARKASMTECFLDAKPGRGSLAPYVFQVVSTSTPLSQPAGAVKTLTYKALGPVQLAKDRTGDNRESAGSGEPKFFQLLVFSSPTSGQDSVYNDWYDHQHVPDVLRTSGFISGQRFVLIDAAQGNEMKLPPYLVLFTFESADLSVTESEMVARTRDGRTRMSPAFDLQSGRQMIVTPL